MLKNTFKFLLLVLITTALCVAQQGSIERQGDAWTNVVNGSFASARNLRVRLQGGEVRVQGGSNQGISYVIRNKAYEGSEERARRMLESYKVSYYLKGDTAWIVGNWESGRPHKFSSDVTITVPRDLDSVKIETEGGAIVATGIAGRLDAQSAGGAIHLDDIGGAISVETGGGRIDVGNVGGDLTLRTGGGEVHIGSVKGKVVAETGGGNMVLVSSGQGASLQTGAGSIHVDKCTGKLSVTTGGGTIELGDIAGEVMTENGAGNIKLGSASGPVKIQTGGGGIELWGVPAARVETGAGAITAKFISASGPVSDSELETGTGDITVYLVPNLHITVRASIEAASGHRITSDFPEIRIASEGDWGPKFVSAEGNLNGGGPVLKIRTTMGNVYIRRAQ